MGRIWGHRRSRLAAAGVGLLLVIAGAAASCARVAEEEAKTQLAESRALAGSSLAVSASDPEAALLLGVEALRLVENGTPGETYEARRALVSSWQRYARVRAILRGHRGAVRALAFSPDGRRIASGGEDGGVRVWDLRRRVELVRNHDHVGGVRALAWNPDGTILASAGADGLVRLWTAEDLAPLAVLRGHKGGVAHLTFSSNGRVLASGGNSWEHPPVDRDFTVRLWDVALRRQTGATLEISPAALQFEAGGRHLRVLSVPGRMTRHDARSPKPYAEPAWDTGYTELYSAAFTGNGRSLVLTGEAGVQLWRVNGTNHTQIDTAILPRSASAVQAGKTQVAVGTRGGVVTVAPPEFQPDFSLQRDPVSVGLHHGTLTALAMDAAEVTLAAGGEDGTVRVVQVGSRSPLARPIGRRIASDARILLRSEDGAWKAEIALPWDERQLSTVTITDKAGRQVERSLKTRGGLAAFHPDGERIALVGRDGRVQLWNIEAGTPESERFPGGFPGAEAALLAFSPDGTVIAAGHQWGLRLWDVDRWAPLGERFAVGKAMPVELYYDRRRGGFVFVSASELSFYTQSHSEYGDISVELVEPLLTRSDYEPWRERVCELLARNLTRNEWRIYVPSRPYQRTCA